MLALLAMWLVGMNQAAEGYIAIRAIHDPLSVLPSSVSGEVMVQAFVNAMGAHARLNLPIGIAQLLLGAGLMLVAMKALIARRVSLSFALQMLLANGLLLAVSYALRVPVRGAIVDQVVAGGLGPPPSGVSAEEFARVARVQLWWSFRIALGLELATAALSAFALTRRAARALLAPTEPSRGES